MEKNKTIDCAECGASIKLEGGMAEGFCLHCGAKFTIGEKIEIKTAEADKLFLERDWPMLWQLLEGSNGGGRLGVYRILSSFDVNYKKYIEESIELEKKTRPKALFEMFVGRNSYATDQIHEEFRKYVAGCVDDLLAAQKQLKESETAGREACAIVMEMLLREKNREATVYWPLVACEQLCVPLIPFVGLEKLTELYSEYDRVNPKNQMLPNQKNVKKAIADEIVYKGGEVPKASRFWKK